ncbi:LysR family transcriptional regulator [Neobacillus rhizophilus]|uniref:LysR family transcriptional regulator n=1 Tax=Neobacillus rhizophilus TaxID=2833579 RepID=A0A942U9P7_9BACI|nr:LysR family transcriptional regulator [Neobacillus rhizophilus]MBU8916067.1 LysR family transcriptional regulator [Bacillus sp. FJAT-29953]
MRNHCHGAALGQKHKAAEDLFLSQSTISTPIQSLEKSLNMKLFDRVGPGSVRVRFF